MVRSVNASELAAWLAVEMQKPHLTLREGFAQFLKDQGAALE